MQIATEHATCCVANQYVMKKTKWATLYAKLTASEEQFGKLGYFWKSRFFLNKNMQNHWLQVQLVGPPTNRQAIGARVTVVTPEGNTRSRWVGLRDRITPKATIDYTSASAPIEKC